MRFTKRFFDIQQKRGNYTFENAFVDGFNYGAPDCYDPTIDGETSTPWCWPFYVEPDIILEGSCAFDAGFKYARSIYSELLEYWNGEE